MSLFIFPETRHVVKMFAWNWRGRVLHCHDMEATGTSSASGIELACATGFLDWSRRSGLNRRPADYESAALPLSYAGQAGSVKPE